MSSQPWAEDKNRYFHMAVIHLRELGWSYVAIGHAFSYYPSNVKKVFIRYQKEYSYKGREIENNRKEPK